MQKPILMPQVGQDLDEGKLIELKVKLGDVVRKGDIVAIVESEKASFEVEAFEAGTVVKILYAEGDATTVLAPLLFVETGDQAETAPVPAPAPEEPDTAALEESEAAAPGAAVPAVATRATSAPQPPAVVAKSRRSSPLARRIAGDNTLNLADVAGSGPGGAVVLRDVQQALQSAARTFAPAPLQPTAPPAGGTLHRVWLRKGQGAPVVMVHGFGADHNSWRVLAGGANLARPILAVDLPGHGQSPEGGRSLEAIAAAVAATLAEEGVTEADLVGHSLGAAVVVSLAETARFNVRSLFLLSPAGLGPDINAAFLAGFNRASSQETLAPWMRLLVADESHIGPALVRITAETRARPGVADAQRRLAEAVFPDGTQLISVRKALGELAIPVRIVVGAADRIVPAHHASGLPGTVGLHVFANVGHMPFLEMRDAVARLLGEHLRSAA